MLKESKNRVKKGKFHWSLAANKVFKKLKEAFSNATMLCH